MENNEKTEKKPYTPPMMEIVKTIKPISLLCCSDGNDDDDYNGEGG